MFSKLQKKFSGHTPDPRVSVIDLRPQTTLEVLLGLLDPLQAGELDTTVQLAPLSFQRHKCKQSGHQCFSCLTRLTLRLVPPRSVAHARQRWLEFDPEDVAHPVGWDQWQRTRRCRRPAVRRHRTSLEQWCFLVTRAL